MTKEEAQRLAKHIKQWSDNNKQKDPFNPQVHMIGNGTWVVILCGYLNYHVWSWRGWRHVFEPDLDLDLVLNEEEEGIEA